jgi:hypothetical protein
MKEQVQKTFEALFALEDIREVFREALPTGPGPDEERAIREGVARVRAILDDLEAGRSPAPSISGTGKRHISTSSRSRPPAA